MLRWYYYRKKEGLDLVFGFVLIQILIPIIHKSNCQRELVRTMDAGWDKAVSSINRLIYILITLNNCPMKYQRKNLYSN